MAFNAGDIQAKLTLDRSDFQAGLDLAKEDARKFADGEYKATLGLDDHDALVQLYELKARAEEWARGKYDATLGFNTSGANTSGLKQQVDDASKSMDDLNKKAASTGSGIAAGMLPALIAIGAFPGAAAAAGVAAAGIPLMFAAASFMLLKQNQQVVTTFSNEWNGIKDQLTADMAPMAGVFVQIAQESNLAFHSMGDQIQLTFEGAAQSTLLFSHGLEALITNLMPGLQATVGSSLPAISGLNSLLAQTGTGISQLLINVSSSSQTAGSGMQYLGTMVQNLLGSLGTLLGQLSGGWASIGPQFVGLWNSLLNVITGFTAGAIPSLVSGLKSVLDAVSPIISVLTPLAPLLGSLGGSMGVFFGIAKGLSAPLGSLGTSLTDTASKMEKAAGSGTTMSGMLDKMGKAASGAAKALPWIGAAVGLVQGAWEATFSTMDQATQAMTKGGQATADMTRQLSGNDLMVQQVKDSFGSWVGDMFAHFVPTTASVTASIDKQNSTLSEVQRLSNDAASAQVNYNTAVSAYGSTSKIASDMLDIYRADLKNVEQAQNDQTKALQTTMDAENTQINDLLGLVGANLNYSKALQTVNNDEAALVTAIQKNGAASNQAKTAADTYEQSILNVVTAAGKQAAALDAADTKTGQANAATQAEIATILGLAAAAGNNAPPALRQLVAGLNDSEISAFAATTKIAGTRQAVVQLPNGKTITINVNSNGQAVAAATNGALNSIPNVTNKYLDFYVNTIVRGPGAATAGSAGGMAGLLGIAGHASGGSTAPDRPFIAGEQGPELVLPNGRSQFVMTNRQTRAMAEQAAAASTGSGLSPSDLVLAVQQGVYNALNLAQMSVSGSGLAKLVANQNLLLAKR